MNFIKRFFINLDAKRRASNCRSYIKKLGLQSGYALDSQKIHSFFADGQYDVYDVLKDKICSLDGQCEAMKDDLWAACVKHHVEIKEGLTLELVYVGSKLIFSNVDFYHKLYNLQARWQGTSWRITKGEKWDSFDFDRPSFVERLKKLEALKQKNVDGDRSETTKQDEFWFICDLNFIAYQLRELKKIIRNWELKKVPS